MLKGGLNSGWQTVVINIWVWFKRKVIEYALVVGTQRLFVVFSWTCNNFISLIILALSKSGILWQVAFCKYDTYFSHPGRLLFSIHSPWSLFQESSNQSFDHDYNYHDKNEVYFISTLLTFVFCQSIPVQTSAWITRRFIRQGLHCNGQHSTFKTDSSF